MYFILKLFISHEFRRQRICKFFFSHNAINKETDNPITAHSPIIRSSEINQLSLTSVPHSPICIKDNHSRSIRYGQVSFNRPSPRSSASFYSSTPVNTNLTPKIWSSTAINFLTIVLLLVDEIYDEMETRGGKADSTNYYPPIIPRVLSCTGNNVITILRILIKC